MSYKDPVPGFRATPTQEDLISDPSLHHVYENILFPWKASFAHSGGQDVSLIIFEHSWQGWGGVHVGV